MAKTAFAAPPADFLAGIWGVPEDSEEVGEVVQAKALTLWAELLERPAAFALRARPGGASAAPPHAGAPPASLDLLPRLLCTLGHVDAGVRAAALRCVSALAARIDDWWPAGATPLSKPAAAAVLQALSAQAAAIEADAEATEWLLRHALDGEAAAAAAAPSPGGRAPSRSPKGKARAASDAPAPATRLELAAPHAAALAAFLLGGLPAQRGEAGLNAALFTLRVVADAAEPRALLVAGHRLLRGFALGGAPLALRPLPTPLEQELAAELVSLYNDATIAAAAAAGDAEGGPVIEALLAVMAVPGPAGADAARGAALRAITPTAYGTLSEEQQRAAFVVSSRSARLVAACSNLLAALGSACLSASSEDVLPPLCRRSWTPPPRTRTRAAGLPPAPRSPRSPSPPPPCCRCWPSRRCSRRRRPPTSAAAAGSPRRPPAGAPRAVRRLTVAWPRWSCFSGRVTWRSLCCWCRSCRPPWTSSWLPRAPTPRPTAAPPAAAIC